MMQSINRLFPGQSARIQTLNGKDTARLRDLGFVEDGLVTCLFSSALGDPVAYRVRDTVVALRGRDAEGIACVPVGGDA